MQEDLSVDGQGWVVPEEGGSATQEEIFQGLEGVKCQRKSRNKAWKRQLSSGKGEENSRIFQVEMTDLQTDVGKLRGKGATGREWGQTP